MLLGSVDTQLDRNFAEGMSYTEQYILIYFAIFLVEVIWLLFNMKGFKDIGNLYKNSKTSKEGADKFFKVVQKCYTIPKNTFVILAIAPPIAGITVFLLLGFDPNAVSKIMLVLLTIALILGTISYLGSKAVFRKILKIINNTLITKKGKLSITQSFLFQLIPVSLICLLSSYFLVSNSNLENKSLLFKKHYEDNIHSIYKDDLNISTKDAIKLLKNIELLQEDDEIKNGDTIYFMDSNNTCYRYATYPKLSSFYTYIHYETILNDNNEPIEDDVYLVDPNTKHIYETKNGIKKLPDNYTYSIEKVPVNNNLEDDGTYIPTTYYEKLTIYDENGNSIKHKFDGIYKFDNYNGVSYTDIESSLNINDFYVFTYIDEELAFPYGIDNTYVKPIDANLDFFFTYSKSLSNKNDNRIYGYYGNEIQGVKIPIVINNKPIDVLVSYDLSNTNTFSIVQKITIVFIFTSFILYNFASSFKTDVSQITNGIEKLANGNTDNLNDNLLVTSNDEIGRLVVGFNKVQDLTKDNIEEIKTNEQMLMEKERLASLGEMIGGIAHNMKTPIMSIAGGAEGLTELISEYRASIDNPSVTAEDHKEIAQDMLDWVTKIKSHISYMSDIITAVKGQASQFASTDNEDFTVYELSKRVEILIKHEIKRSLLNLKIEIFCDPSIMLHGDINNLIQVINNLISNSIYSYDGKPDETIYFTIDAEDDNIILEVKDNGCGMNEETKAKLFKQMYTTKGKNGTGLGLYMSYSTIKGKFNGNISFESEENVGTTFTITIPKNRN